MSDRTEYRIRLKIPVDSGDSTTKFFTKCETPVAVGYQRIVIGGRGPYIEFSENQIIRKNIHVPATELWRLGNDISFYDEYRTQDACNVKIYFQKKPVNYADYKLDCYYISPFDLKTEHLDAIIKSIKQSTVFDTEKFF